jgi:polygalacturonase
MNKCITISRFLSFVIVVSCGGTVACAEDHPDVPEIGPSHPAADMHVVPPELNPPPKPIFDPRNYGARGDGITYDTAAIQKAIDACAGSGGSVYLSGGKFLSAELTLKSQMTLYIDKGTVLLGGTRAEDYPVLLPTGNSEEVPLSASMKDLCRSLLYACDIDGLTLEGEGVIDGQGPRVQMFGTEATRPSILRIFKGNHIVVRNLTLNNPRMWTQVYSQCRNLTIDHETVYAPAGYAANLDGCDICDCTDASIHNCRINAEDDGICLKSYSQAGLHNITVENNWITDYIANGIKIGTATVGPISDLHIVNNTIRKAKYGGVCIESVDGSAVSDVTIHGLDMYDVSQPIFIRLAHRSHGVGSIKGVAIDGIRSIAASQATVPSCTITGIPDARIEDVSIKNGYFEMPGGAAKQNAQPPEKPRGYPQSNLFGATPAYGFYVRHASGIVFDHIMTGYCQPDVRPWLASDDAEVKTIQCRDLQKIAPTKPPAD